MTHSEAQNRDLSDNQDDHDTVMPTVNTMHFHDLRQCLRLGIKDFLAAPLFGLFFGSIFAAIGIMIVASLFVWQKSWMIYPFLIGFPLIGPFAAVGLYEVSRRIQNNSPLIWREILGIVYAQSHREIRWMAFVILFIFWIWMYQVRLLVALMLGDMSFSSMESFLNILMNTSQGLTFIVVGHIVGAILALVLYSITVISMPLLLDREDDFITAMITSVSAVLKSPLVMLAWGIFVTLAVLLSFLPLFLGLLVVLPVLGHTTWHIYQRAVEKEDNSN